ncbi:hypothetical protein D3C81_2173770 [compost metagenome]
MQQQVRLKQSVQSYSRCGFATVHQACAMQQLFVEFLDQFEQQGLLAIDVVVNGADLYSQASGQVAHADPTEATSGK